MSAWLPVTGAVSVRLIDGPGTVEFGEVDRLGHLATDPLRALGRRLLEPPLRARPDRQELPLLAAASPGLALKARRPAGADSAHR